MPLKVLYGSVARGEADKLSDRDVLEVGDNPSAKPTGKFDSIVHYSWSEFEGMRAYGSLFLRHLAKESVILEGTAEEPAQYRTILDQLPAYSRVVKDIRAFRTGIDDVAESVREGLASYDFEASQLATIARHSAILGCYLIGHEDYSRLGAVASFCNETGLSEIVPTFEHFYQYRISLSRNLFKSAPPSGQHVLLFADQARRIVEEVNFAYQRGTMLEAGTAGSRSR